MAKLAEKIDALCVEYAAAQDVVKAHKAELKLAETVADELKGRVIELVQNQGVPHAEKSIRLKGTHTVATVTVGSKTTVDAAAVESFRVFLGKQELPEIAGRFFQSHVIYSLVQGPDKVLATLDLPTRVLTRITGLLALCFRVATNAPSLKVEITETA